MHIVLHSDFSAYVAKQALDDKEWKDQDPVKLARFSPGPLTKHLRENRQSLLEMFLARAVDNFQRYLVEMLRETLRKQPAILKSRENSLSLETVLGFTSIDELIHQVIERKVSSLAYQGFMELQEWAADKGIPLRSSNAMAITELIATRNLIVHNRCIVDEKYLRVVKESALKVGDIRAIEVGDFMNALELLLQAVQEIDAAVASKFNLDLVPVELPKQSKGQLAAADACS